MILHTKLTILLKYLMILDILLFEAKIIENHLALVIDKFQHILECITIVSYRANQYHLQIKAIQRLSIQVNILGYRLFFLRQGQTCQAFLKLEHGSFSTRHTFDISVNLSSHFCTDELVNLLLLYRVSILFYKSFRCRVHG